jgi:dUTP pyrophosphatase
MKFKSLHPNFKLPTKGTAMAGAFDIYMPESGAFPSGLPEAVFVPLGFAAEVPEGYVALMLPRSGAGAKLGLELNNTCGVVDSDYRGEWVAALRTKNKDPISWLAGDRLLQILIVPVAQIVPELSDTLSDTSRGTGGFGSTGK